MGHFFDIEKTATESGLTTPGAIAGWGDGASLTVAQGSALLRAVRGVRNSSSYAVKP